MKARRDAAGWVLAGMASATLMAGAAAAALRAAPGQGMTGRPAIAMDLSVGVMAVAPAPPVAEKAPPVGPPPVPQTAAMPPAAPDRPAQDAPSGPDAILPPLPQEQPAEAEKRPSDVAAAPDADTRSAGLTTSLRPAPRPDRKPEQREARRAEPPATPPATAPAPAGGETAARPADRRQTAAGRDLARYADLVLRQVGRQGRRASPERGSAVVGFEIAPDGRLATVRVLRSSGSAGLDRVAMDHVRRAGPFPPTPDAAPARFSFEFVAR